MEIVTVCEAFGWDYNTYMSQPVWFLEAIRDKMEIDSENIKKSSKKK
jgi:hypothetical protein